MVPVELFKIRMKVFSLSRIAIPCELYSRVLATAIANCASSDELIESGPFVMVNKDRHFHVIFMVRSEITVLQAHSCDCLSTSSSSGYLTTITGLMDF